MTAISSGRDDSQVIDEEGNLYEWGFSKFGEHTVHYKTSPTLLQDLPLIVSISSGNGYRLALSEDGSIYEWGMSLSVGQGMEPFNGHTFPQLLLGDNLPPMRAVS